MEYIHIIFHFLKNKMPSPVQQLKGYAVSIISKIVLPAFCFTYHQIGIAQTNNMVWADSCTTNSFYGKIVSEGYSDFARVHPYTGGDVILVGTIESNFAQMAIARNYAHIMRVNSKGDLVWSKFIGIKDSSIQVDLRTYGSVVTADGDIVVLLSINAALLSGNYIVRLNSNGAVVWQEKLQNLSNTLAVQLTEIIETNDKGFLLAGSAGIVGVLLKLNAAGTLTWRKEITGGDFSSNITAITEGSSAYYIAGTGAGLNNNSSANFVAALKKDMGDVQWIKWLSFLGSPPLTGIAEYEFEFMDFKDGVIALTGNTSSIYAGTNKSAEVVVYMDENANILSSSRIENMEIAMDQANMFQGSLYDAYSKTGVQFQNADNGDYYVFRLNKDDTPRWAWKISLPEMQAAKDTKLMADSSIAVAGFSRNANNVVAASLLKTTNGGKLETCVNESYQLSVITKTVSLQDIPNVQETSGTTNQSVASSLDTANGSGFSWQLQCSYQNSSRISKINGNKAVCKGSNNLYSITRGGEYSKSISFSANTPIAATMLSDTSAAITFLKEGTFMLYASMEAPCGILKDSMVVQVQESTVSFSLGVDTVICPKNKILLKADAYFSSYVWQDGVADSLYTVTTPGVYYVTVTDACGRSMRDTIVVSAAPSFDFSVGADRQKCNADTLQLSGPVGFYNYNWSPAYNISSTQGQNVIVNPLVDTFYSVTAEKSPGCFGFDTVRISVKNTPEIKLGPDTFLCNNQSLLLNAGPGFDNYLWNDGKTTADNLITQPGMYAVTAHYNNGCTASDSITISDNFCSNDIYVPAAFTPNNDGLNEIFRPIASKPLVQYRFEIFTRWGQKIFETTDIKKGWDGKFNGTNINITTAVWVCAYQFEGKNKNVKKGTVVLIK